MRFTANAKTRIPTRVFQQSQVFSEHPAVDTVRPKIREVVRGPETGFRNACMATNLKFNDSQFYGDDWLDNNLRNEQGFAIMQLLLESEQRFRQLA